VVGQELHEVVELLLLQVAAAHRPALKEVEDRNSDCFGFRGPLNK
jgi:hypothetical protein